MFVDKFIWQMCVSYRVLNVTTLPFQYPISCCNLSIDTINEERVAAYIIVLDYFQDYHQAAVNPRDQEKLTFFGPDHGKYCSTVIPFGVTNALPFFLAMIKRSKDEWTHIFDEKMSTFTNIDNKTVSLKNRKDVY